MRPRPKCQQPVWGWHEESDLSNVRRLRGKRGTVRMGDLADWLFLWGEMKGLS